VKTVVLDDDPTGTQSATGVEVLFDADARSIAAALATADSVYLQTNSRAIDEESAVALARRLRAEVEAAAAALDVDIRFVLRGDSTLRGHVFAETAVFENAHSIVVFVPAFPAGGRVTRDGVHYVRSDGLEVPAADTEYADDPVFPFHSSSLVDYVAEKSGRVATPVPLEEIRSGSLPDVLANAAPGAVIVPDAETDDDVRAIATAITSAIAAGTSVVVRCASPLAAALAGVASERLLTGPLVDSSASVLVVCGSHTAGATAQLATLAEEVGPPVIVDTERALADSPGESVRVTAAAAHELHHRRLAVIASERQRRREHNTLEHGEKVMETLIATVSGLLAGADLIISKGGITSSEIASRGIGADRAWVLGQILPGVSLWRMRDRHDRELHYVVVPGNVGNSQTLVDAVRIATGDRVFPPA
jgi:uncharacterized protein YgbK (DUF1537 family)